MDDYNNFRDLYKEIFKLSEPYVLYGFGSLLEEWKEEIVEVATLDYWETRCLFVEVEVRADSSPETDVCKTEKILQETIEIISSQEVHPTEIRTSISPSLAVELNTTSALANYATEAGMGSQKIGERQWRTQNMYLGMTNNQGCVGAEGGERRGEKLQYTDPKRLENVVLIIYYPRLVSTWSNALISCWTRLPKTGGSGINPGRVRRELPIKGSKMVVEEGDVAEQFPTVLEFFKGRTILVTGATGFLGKVLVEKLLRTTDVDRVYMFFRPKRGQEVKQRMDTFVQSKRMASFDRERYMLSKLVSCVCRFLAALVAQNVAQCKLVEINSGLAGNIAASAEFYSAVTILCLGSNLTVIHALNCELAAFVRGIAIPFDTATAIIYASLVWENL
uniref:Fatty acyl-CoA reductase n=1 Tax=Timema bartmani TaxID=61472 RepID=A0A7R9F2I3_9NEOP|nr:unnamed protein product [Timema bartmani]